MSMVGEIGLDDIRGCLSHKEKTPPTLILFSIEYIYTKGDFDPKPNLLHISLLKKYLPIKSFSIIYGFI